MAGIWEEEEEENARSQRIVRIQRLLEAAPAKGLPEQNERMRLLLDAVRDHVAREMQVPMRQCLAAADISTLEKKQALARWANFEARSLDLAFITSAGKPSILHVAAKSRGGNGRFELELLGNGCPRPRVPLTVDVASLELCPYSRPRDVLLQARRSWKDTVKNVEKGNESSGADCRGR